MLVLRTLSNWLENMIEEYISKDKGRSNFQNVFLPKRYDWGWVLCEFLNVYANWAAFYFRKKKIHDLRKYNLLKWTFTS